ncbi:hypothetical protein GCM10028786_13590 [Flaviaesturariibacter terrae]
MDFGTDDTGALRKAGMTPDAKVSKLFGKTLACGRKAGMTLAGITRKPIAGRE